MKRCPQCGAELPDEARFCMQCAAAQGRATSAQPRVEGSGAIAQGEGTVAASGGSVAVGGNVDGNISTGSGSISRDHHDEND